MLACLACDTVRLQHGCRGDQAIKHALHVDELAADSLVQLRSNLAEGVPADSEPALRRALEMAWETHLREPDASPVKAAVMLQRLGADVDTRIAALLAPDSTLGGLSLDDVAAQFGPSVGGLVRNVRWMQSFGDAAAGTPAPDSTERAESMRRMLMTTVDDVRAVLVKLVFQLGLLEGLGSADLATRKAVARETFDIYAPLANRLGVAQLKWALEDLAFRESKPEAYKRVARSLEERRTDREQYVEAFVAHLNDRLVTEGFVNAQVSGRVKHLYSIWRKMVRKRLEFDQLFDVRAVRVLVQDVRDCYGVLGLVHSTWVPIPSEFDDYIANPKENGYRSLHTAVYGPGGRPVEIQVRTLDMDRDAELGVAAHWAYKEGGTFDQRLQQSINALRQLLEGGGDVKQLASEALGERVYIFTPNGDVKDLPIGSTALDFAYAVHTDIGHRCRGAKVNGVIAALNRPLATGDRVEIMTAREPRPSRNWLTRELGYLASSRSRAKVRAWFNARQHDENLAEGRSLIDAELRRQNASSLKPEDLVKPLRQESLMALCVGLGRGSVSLTQLAACIESLRRPAAEKQLFKSTQASAPRSGEISVSGVGQLLTRIAPCCNPVPYDDIVGFITRGKGVTVHRVDCNNVVNLPDADVPRLIEVDWGVENGGRYTAKLRIEAWDRNGLLRDISAVFSNANIGLSAMNLDTDPAENTTVIHVSCDVPDGNTLNAAMTRLYQVPNVTDVRRQSS